MSAAPSVAAPPPSPGEPLALVPYGGRRRGGERARDAQFVRGSFPIKYRWVRHSEIDLDDGRQAASSFENALWWNENALATICTFLPARALAQLSRVNRCARPLTREEHLWRRLCRLEFGVVPEALDPPPGTSHMLYQHLFARRNDLMKYSMQRPQAMAGGKSLRILVAPLGPAGFSR